MYQKDLSRQLRGCFPGLGDDLETQRESPSSRLSQEEEIIELFPGHDSSP